ncbi:hypothetical protein V2H45_20470 [Tumidithrix elongata RA019]|uniref:Lipoprotein SmpA/OmlA domain-containing protein n=1 Tax=Tumidithrix elongata BACA0141 TaxID=2716417 RepID=A0AAW9Q7E8_9CYAN|nr:hypothetical protein [Tumidithrix elongata RA019]
MLSWRMIGAVSAIAFLISLTQTFSVDSIRANSTATHSFPLPQSQFDATIWRDLALIDKEPHPRLIMAEDLVRTRSLDGLSRQQVLELLGTPTITGNLLSAYPGAYEYWLSPDTRSSYAVIDAVGRMMQFTNNLEIRFDTKGIVSSYAIVTKAAPFSQPPSQFNSRVWKELSMIAEYPYPRLSMADDLVRTRRLEGLSRQQVLVLLGNPTPSNYFKDRDFKDRYDLIYWLGDSRSGSVAVSLNGRTINFAAVLLIKFDAKGIVSKYAIYRD